MGSWESHQHVWSAFLENKTLFKKEYVNNIWIHRYYSNLMYIELSQMLKKTHTMSKNASKCILFYRKMQCFEWTHVINISPCNIFYLN